MQQTMFHDSNKVQRWSPRCDVTLVDFTAICDQNENDTAKLSLPESEAGKKNVESSQAKAGKTSQPRHVSKRKICYTERVKNDIKPETPETELSKPNQKVIISLC